MSAPGATIRAMPVDLERLPAAASTTTGLTVTAELDTSEYASGLAYTKSTSRPFDEDEAL